MNQFIPKRKDAMPVKDQEGTRENCLAFSFPDEMGIHSQNFISGNFVVCASTRQTCLKSLFR